MPAYCPWCHNVLVGDPASPCSACAEILLNDLRQAKRAYDYIASRFRRCCGGMSTRQGHLYFHGDSWEWSSGDDEFGVSVEAGIHLHVDGATTYYVFDNDSTCMDREYGGKIPYPDSEDGDVWNAWWQAVWAQLGESAEVAFGDDVLTCLYCGYHYHCGVDPHDHGEDL